MSFEDDGGALAIADITLREIAVHIVRKRVLVNQPLAVYLRFVESIFRVLPVNGRIAAQSALFGAAYPNDLADRLIDATGLVHGAKLVTKDEGIRASGEVECVW